VLSKGKTGVSALTCCLRVKFPAELAAGRIHLGVTGTDLVQEKLRCGISLFAPVDELAFGHGGT